MRWRILAGTAGVLLLHPETVSAADSEGDLSTFLWSWFNLIILISVLIYFARKPLLQYVRERKETIERNLAESARLLDDAESRLNEWKTRASHLETEAERIRQESRERAEIERERILAEAHASAARIQRDAEAAIEQELRRARESLREEAAELAIKLAAGLIQENVTDRDQERLLEEFVDRIEPDQGPGARN